MIWYQSSPVKLLQTAPKDVLDPLKLIKLNRKKNQLCMIEKERKNGLTIH